MNNKPSSMQGGLLARSKRSTLSLKKEFNSFSPKKRPPPSQMNELRRRGSSYSRKERFAPDSRAAPYSSLESVELGVKV